MEFLGKTIAVLIVLCLLVGIAAIATATAENPKGLQDKGPLEKVTFIHFKKDNAPAMPNWAKGKPGGTSCYAFLSKGAKWKTTEPYLTNPSNSDSLSETFVQAAVGAGVAEWETFGGNIFGSGSIDYNASYNNGSLDGKNTASFGLYDNPNVIAVTTVWGYFSGPPQTREIIEWDLLFNDASFAFGDATVNPALMDLQNIATHELGHSAGLADLYNTCIEETMYGYSDFGETKKRTLNTGDIQGIQKLYG